MTPEYQRAYNVVLQQSPSVTAIATGVQRSVHSFRYKLFDSKHINYIFVSTLGEVQTPAEKFVYM